MSHPLFLFIGGKLAQLWQEIGRSANVCNISALLWQKIISYLPNFPNFPNFPKLPNFPNFPKLPNLLNFLILPNFVNYRKLLAWDFIIS